VLIGEAVVCVLLAIAAGLWAVAARREWGPLAGAHAHNDYHQNRPLHDALRYGFVSVEADIWAVDGTLQIGHDRTDLRRGLTLRSLYLEPLARRIAVYGAVYPGRSDPFQLIVEVKSDAEETYRLLDAELARYQGILTRYEGETIVPGAVSVIISGGCPREVLAAQDVRYAACDGSLGDVGSGIPASLVPLCSDKLAWRFKWRGRGPMPPEEREKLHRLVAQAHAEGRRVRFWGVPRSPRKVRLAIWRELRAAGVDYLGADRLRPLRTFLLRRPRVER
jgi:hypothetical protein